MPSGTDGVAEFAKIVERVDTGRVAIREVDSISIVADRLHPCHSERLCFLRGNNRQEVERRRGWNVDRPDDLLRNRRAASFFPACRTGTGAAEEPP